MMQNKFKHIIYAFFAGIILILNNTTHGIIFREPRHR